MLLRRSRVTRMLVALCCITAGSAHASGSAPWPGLQGTVRDAQGNPVAGVMLSVASPAPVHRVTVYTREDGGFRTPPLRSGPVQGPFTVRARRVGWRDFRAELSALPRDAFEVTLARETDPARVAAQLPANYWMERVLDRLPDAAEREEFVRQCTFCHQQGNLHTRVERDAEEWSKVILLMGRRGAMLTPDLRERLPHVFIEAYDPATAVPALTAGMQGPDFGPLPAPAVRDAVIEEWDLGGPGSMQHDVMFHPDGLLYGVDMPFDQLHRLDPVTGERRSWDIPTDGLPIGGVFAAKDGSRQNPSSDARVGPHSLQTGPDGSIWITLATGNRLARFDPQSEEFQLVRLDAGFYPHTLRFDAKGRIWYTISASNHLGMHDPATGKHEQYRLPSRTWSQAIVSRAMPFLLWLGRHVDLRGQAAEGEPMVLPVPYGIDVAPDGEVWFSQLNEHRIGRMDPETGEIEVLDTPFPAPRRLRFDSKGRLWIPSYSGSRVARFDPETREFREWELPTEPRGTETPYALHVDRRSDTVWICGTASDTLIRFEPEAERWSIYPLPTRVTYTREIDFDDRGRIWTSNSNGPAWQVEGGVPRVLRLDPEGLAEPPGA